MNESAHVFSMKHVHEHFQDEHLGFHDFPASPIIVIRFSGVRGKREESYKYFQILHLALSILAIVCGVALL